MKEYKRIDYMIAVIAAMLVLLYVLLGKNYMIAVIVAILVSCTILS